jgi:ammonia channel protein AmtB
MSYEAGVARRKNVMATAMKNILTIAVVTPTFYFFGWWVYNCNQAGLPIGPNSSDFTSVACQGGIPWSDAFGPNLTNNINLIFFLAFLLFSWTTASILSGAIIERARISAYLVLAVVLGSFVWMLDAAWGWSAGGWLTLRFGFHDSIASAVVHGVAGAFTLGVLFNVGPRIGKYTREGMTPSSDPTTCTSPRWADADLHRVLRVLRRVPGHRVDLVPGLGEHLPEPDDPRLDPRWSSPWASPAASPAATWPAVAIRSGPSRAVWPA